MRQGRLADAAIAWDVLLTLRPDATEYRDNLAQTRQRIDAAVAERIARAAQAQKRGDTAAAEQIYLSASALQPDNLVAANALRGIEADRNKRMFLGRPSRLTLTRRAVSESEMSPSAAATAESNDLEYAAMLAGQGEIDEAIDLMEKRVALVPRDEPSRRLLADLYYQKANAVAVKDKAQAVALLRQSVRLDPRHAAASAKLKQLVPIPTPAQASASSRATTIGPPAAQGSASAPSR